MAQSTLLAPESAVRKNCRIKIYPDGTIGEILACSLDCFTPPGWERVNPPPRDNQTSDDNRLINIGRSRRRAKQSVSDYIMANRDMDIFFTLTLRPQAESESGKIIGRTDYKAINRKLQQWLADRVRRRGLKYVAVYEYHNKVESDGLHALHIHGVANHSALQLVPSGRKYRDKLGHWHNIYNVNDWSLGVTTAMYLYGERGRATNYICKYIYKSDEPIGGRWYMHSHNLLSPSYEYINIDFMDAPARAIRIDAAHCAYKWIHPSRINDII